MYGCYSENEVALCEQWGAQEIVNRSLRLLAFLEKRWEILLGDDQKKVELQGLEFVAQVEAQVEAVQQFENHRAALRRGGQYAVVEIKTVSRSGSSIVKMSSSLASMMMRSRSWQAPSSSA